MAYNKVWTFDLNKTPASQVDLTDQCRSFWFEFKSFITGAGWTIVKSCDSTQVQNSDTWAARSNLVAGTGAHSWITFKSPVGFVAGLDGSYTGDQSCVWITISFNYLNYYQIKIIIHQAAPSGGTTSSDPASTNQNVYATQQFNRTVLNTNARFSFVKTSQGYFYCVFNFISSGFFPFIFFIWPCINVTFINSLNIDYPYAFCSYCNFVDSGAGAIVWSELGGSNLVKGFAYDGTSTNLSLNSSSGYGAGSLTGSSFIIAGDTLNGTHTKLPAWLVCNTSNKTGVIGSLPDFYMGGNPTLQSDVDAASPEYCRCGSAWLPADASIQC